MVHRLWVVVLFYGVTVFVAGVLVSVVFQLAHCVEEAEFPPCLEKDLLRLKKPGDTSSGNHSGLCSWKQDRELASGWLELSD